MYFASTAGQKATRARNMSFDRKGVEDGMRMEGIARKAPAGSLMACLSRGD